MTAQPAQHVDRIRKARRNVALSKRALAEVESRLEAGELDDEQLAKECSEIITTLRFVAASLSRLTGPRIEAATQHLSGRGKQ